MIALVKINDSGKNEFYEYVNLNLENDIIVIMKKNNSILYGRVIRVLKGMSLDNKHISGNILRIANKNDYTIILENNKYQSTILLKCKELVKKYNLNMRIIDTFYTFDRDQIIIRYLADERIDFRQLAKELGSIYRVRIELRQVGIRDKAQFIGGLGPCGRKICCNSFLCEFESVSINMAKNQNLALNPNKINGVCGRLKCCLTFENENYINFKKELPEINSRIKTDFGFGKVISLDILQRKYKVLLDNDEVLEVSINSDCKK